MVIADIGVGIADIGHHQFVFDIFAQQHTVGHHHQLVVVYYFAVGVNARVFLGDRVKVA